MPNLHKSLPLSLCVLITLAARMAMSTPLTLVSDGQASSVIVIPAVPNDGADYAAKDLQWHLKKVTGADVPIINDRAEIPDGRVPIYIGESRGTTSLGLSTRDFASQEYTLKFLDGAIVLMGRDVVEYPVTSRRSRPKTQGAFGSAWNPGWGGATVVEHGFKDEAGTFECFVFQPDSTNEASTGLMLFGIGNDQHCHRLSAEKYDGKNYGLVYETVANGQSSKAIIRDAWPKRSPGWHHVMCTWDAKASKQEIYFDGTLMDSAPYTQTQCAAAPAFGIKCGSDGIPYCVGPLDELRLSRVVRTAAVPTGPFVTDDDTLILMHFDDASGFPHDSSEQPRTINRKPPRDGNLATMYAVYDFIEQYLNVRWYLPGEIGMVFEPLATLTVDGKDVRRKPAMISRLSDSGTIGYGEDKWGGQMTRLLFADASPEDIDKHAYRLRYGGPQMAANHSFYGFHNRYKQWKANPQDPGLKNFPDDVALFEKGSLMAQGYPEPTQLCYTSPDTVAQAIKDARKYFDEGAAKDGASVGPDWFGLVPSDDGWWCKCDDCQAALKFKGKESGNNIPTFGSGLESNASLLVWNFTRKVADEVYKSHPNKLINQLAYIEYLGVPRDAQGKVLDLPPNLVLGCCLGTRPILNFDPAQNGEMAMYKEWMAISKQKNWRECFWLYQCFPNQFGAMQGYITWPGFHAHNLDKSMRMFIEDDVDGIFLCGIADYIDGYLTFKYMFNPDFNVDDELNEFFTRFYGPAATPMKEFYLLTEKRFLDPNNYPRKGYQAAEGITWSSIGTPPVMDELHDYILDARKAVEGAEPYKRRVDIFCTAVWDLMKEGSAAWLAKQPGGQHPWPFRVQGPFETQERGIPYFGRAYFRNNANPVGLWEHGFNDQQGTMEAAVWCGPLKTNGNSQGLGTLFEISPLDLSSGHRVEIKANPVNTGYVVSYETWAQGRTNRVSSAPLNTNQWHHISACWKSGSNGVMALVVDQKVAGKKPYQKTACKNAATFDIGGGIKGMSFGAIDEVRLSSIVRPAKKQSGQWEPDPNTLLLLHFDEDEGQPIRDHSGVQR